MYSESLVNKTIITPNTRMAEQITISLAKQAMLDTEKKVATKADIQSLSSFIKNSYQNLRFVTGYETLPPLVDSSYLYVNFLKAIHNNSPDVLLDPSELASAASTTFKNIEMWEVPSYQAENKDHEYFLMWSLAVRKEIKNLNIAFEWDALDVITKAILDGDLKIIKDVGLFGFDDYPPKVAKLIEAMSMKGVVLSYPWYKQDNRDIEELVLKSDDPRSHYQDVAKAVYNIYKEDSTKKVAVVHPTLHQSNNAMKLLAELSTVFEPQFILPQTPAYTKPFNVTFGSPLSSNPIIDVVFRILNILSGEISQDDVLDLISSVFIRGNSAESIKRTKVAANVRNSGRQMFDLDCLIRETTSATLLNNQLRDLRQANSQAKAMLRPSEWVNHIVTCLDAIGWAKGRKLNSTEYQVYTKFSQSLMLIKKHDRLFGEIPFDYAFKVIALYINGVAFKAEADRDCPIQVMGALEAGGMQFDTVIFMHMDNVTWPGAALTSSFLPINVQVEYDMPHNSSQRELDFATKITSRITSAANKVIYSYFTKVKGENNEASFVVKGKDLPKKYIQSADIDYMASEVRKTPCNIVSETIMPLMRSGRDSC